MLKLLSADTIVLLSNSREIGSCIKRGNGPRKRCVKENMLSETKVHNRNIRTANSPMWPLPPHQTSWPLHSQNSTWDSSYLSCISIFMRMFQPFVVRIKHQGLTWRSRMYANPVFACITEDTKPQKCELGTFKVPCLQRRICHYSVHGRSRNFKRNFRERACIHVDFWHVAVYPISFPRLTPRAIKQDINTSFADLSNSLSCSHNSSCCRLLVHECSIARLTRSSSLITFSTCWSELESTPSELASLSSSIIVSPFINCSVNRVQGCFPLML